MDPNYTRRSGAPTSQLNVSCTLSLSRTLSRVFVFLNQPRRRFSRGVKNRQNRWCANTLQSYRVPIRSIQNQIQSYEVSSFRPMHTQV